MSNIRAFMYHDVRDLEDTKFPERYKLKSFLNVKQFENQIDYIKNNYTIIKSSDILDIDLKEEKKDYAILTFDDGLKDHYKNVYSYLNKHNIPATFCVASRPILEHHIIDSHKIQFILASTDEKKLTDVILHILAKNYDHLKQNIWDKYSISKWKNNWWTPEMVFITNCLRDNTHIIDDLFTEYVGIDSEQFSKDLYLNVNEIEEISNNKLMTIAGHGYTSTDLTKVFSPYNDIKKSIEFIKKYTDKIIFSYPNGGYMGVVKYLRELNCSVSFTTEPKTITELDDFNPLLFPRYDAPQKLPL